MTLKIGRFFGINLFLHWSFWLLPLYVVFTSLFWPEAASLGLRLVLLAALFIFVVLHEYGHALMARSFGIGTRDITLYPIGGVASLERMSEKSWEEFWIAVAGPMVNFVLAGAIAFGMFVTTLVRPTLLHGFTGQFVFLLFLLNIVLCVFNMLPAFPMDGGRVLRALLAVPLDRLTATRIAVCISVALAAVFGVGYAYFAHSMMPIVIAVFLIWAGQQELRALEYQYRRREDAVREPESASADWTGQTPATVAVYIWDSRKHEWIPQGVIPARSYAEPGQRAF